MNKPTPPTLYLASQSPRRRQLLAQIGIAHQQLDVTINEDPLPGETPVTYVKRITLAKLAAGQALVPNQLVLAADTAVVAGDRIMGKPKDKNEAVAMLLTLSGKTHQVLTGVGVGRTALRYRLNTSSVTFRSVSLQEAEAYWSTGEPRGKAGAYAIQGLAAQFIETLEGSYSGVMGLPLFETAQLLQNYGLAEWYTT